MGRIEFEEFLRRILEEEKEEKEIDWSRKKKEFLQAVDELFNFVENCLKPYREKVVISYEEICIEEEKLGTYKSKKMIIKISNRKATLTPIGVTVIAASGRVDLEGETGIVRIVRVPTLASKPLLCMKDKKPEKRVWKIATPPPEIRYIDLDCDLFFDSLIRVLR
jgi:hypothetical protein